ncbi:MAG: SgcJ/EcaC family oxidoreductase [Gemmataceae bacterium]|nr:SgcJ/EcaC family oxidoreductase [Gemmataceae bacterium]
MKRLILAAGLLATAVIGIGMAREQGGPPGAPAGEAAAVRAVVDAFVAAYDKHDAEALSALFLPDAKVITEDGDVIEGREAIARTFAALFAEYPATKIEIAVDSIKMIGKDLAVEVGSSKTIHAPGADPEVSKYTVVHCKRDGKWLMALARDNPADTASAHEQLKPLAWMVGDWIDESPAAVVSTSCKWSADKNYLMQDIVVKSAGKATMTVQQRIGYDPVQKCIRSWAFDSEGGVVDGHWTRTPDGWMVKATGYRSDGATASATNTYTPTGKDSYVWRSTDRVVGGNLADPVEVRVARKPPVAATK